MLLTREQMRFDFQGARLDPVRDREVLGWAMQQFLYGEVTGIQVGHWLYHAPDLEAARFLARQSLEEMQHVGNFLRILELLGVEPAPAHPMVRFLSTGMMGGTWAEHVATEMALGEGLVLHAFYALIDTVDHPEVVAILERGVRQEERHVAFGELQTQKVIAGRPWLRRRLLGLSIVWLWGVGRLAAFLRRRLPEDHPVLGRLPDFVRHVVSTSELRLVRMGVADRPVSAMSRAARVALVLEAAAGKLASALLALALLPVRSVGLLRPRLLTETYLDDPHLRGAPARDRAEDEARDAEDAQRA